MAEWKTVGELFDFEKGSLQSSKCIPGEYPFITAAEEWKTHESYTHDCEALVFAMAAAGSLGRTHYVNGRFISSDLCFILTPKQDLRLDLVFYHRLFNLLRPDIVQKTATGTSKLSINSSRFRTFRLPYFDYEYQVDSRAKIEAIAKIMDELSAQLDQQSVLLSRLRQQTLQEATEGKLTAEWRREHRELISGDNHATKLLGRIRAEKERFIKEGVVKKDRTTTPVHDDEKPFGLPDGWAWCRMADLGIINPRNYIDDDLEVSFSSMASIPSEYGVRAGFDVRRWGVVKSGYTHFADNDVAVAKITPCFENSKSCVFKELVNGYGAGTTELHVIRPITVNPEYIHIFLKTPSFLRFGKAQMTGECGQKRVPVGCFSDAIFPLPPLTEQQVIAETVGKIMAMMDELTQKVSERKEQSEMLMQAVLREAFETS